VFSVVAETGTRTLPPGTNMNVTVFVDLLVSVLESDIILLLWELKAASDEVISIVINTGRQSHIFVRVVCKHSYVCYINCSCYCAPCVVP